MACLNRNQKFQEINEYDPMQENLDEILLSRNAIQANRQMRDILKSRGKQTGGSIDDVRKAIQTQQSHTWFQFPSASDLLKKIKSSTLGQNIAKYLKGDSVSASSANLTLSNWQQLQQNERSNKRGEKQQDEDGESQIQIQQNQFGLSQSSSLTQNQQGQRGQISSGSCSQSPQPYNNNSNFQQSQQPYKQSQQSSTLQQQRIFDNSQNNVIINYNKFSIRNNSQSNNRNISDIDPFSSDSSTPCISNRTNNIVKGNNNGNNCSEKQINNYQTSKSNLFSNIYGNQQEKSNQNNGRQYLESNNSQSEDSCVSGSDVQNRFQSQLAPPAYDSSKSNYFQVKYGTTAKNIPQPMKLEQTSKPNIAQRVIVFYSNLKIQNKKKTTTFPSYNTLSIQRPVAIDPYTFRPYVQEKAINSQRKANIPGVKRVAKETAQMQVERIMAQQRNLHKANWTVLEQSRKVEQLQKERADRLQAEKNLKQSLLKNAQKKLAGDKKRIFAINEEADHDGDAEGDIYEEQTLKIPAAKNLRPSSEVQTSCSSDDGDFKGLSKNKVNHHNLSKNNNFSANNSSDNSKLQHLQDVYKQFDQMVVHLSSQPEVLDMLKKLMNSISESKNILKVQQQTTVDGGAKQDILQRQIQSPPSGSFHIDQILNNSANKSSSTQSQNTTAIIPIIPQRSLFKSKDSDDKSSDETKNNLFKNDGSQNQNKTNNIFATVNNQNNAINTAVTPLPVVNIFAPVANITATPSTATIPKEQTNIFAVANSESVVKNILSKGNEVSLKSAEDQKETVKQSPAVIAQNIFGAKEVNAKIESIKPAEIIKTAETPAVVTLKHPEPQNEKHPETKVDVKDTNTNQEGTKLPIVDLPAKNQVSSKETQPIIISSESKKNQQIGQSSIEVTESNTQSEMSLKKSELGIRRSESSIVDHDPIPENNNQTIQHKMVESVITKTADDKKEGDAKENKDSKSKNIFAPQNINNPAISTATIKPSTTTVTATNLFAQPISNPFAQNISNPFDQKLSNPFAQQSSNSSTNAQQVSTGVAVQPPPAGSSGFPSASSQQNQPNTTPSQPLSLDQLIAQKTNKNLFTQNNAISSTKGDNLFSTSNSNPLVNIFGNVNQTINQNQSQSQQTNQINNNNANLFADNKNIPVGSASTQGTATNIWSQNNGLNNQGNNNMNQNQQTNIQNNNNTNTANNLFNTNNSNLFSNNSSNNQMVNKNSTTGNQPSNNIFGNSSNPFGNQNNNQNLQVPFNNNTNNNNNQLNSSFNQNNVSFSSQNMFIDAPSVPQNNTNLWNTNNNNNNNNVSNQNTTNNIWSRQPQPQTFSNPSTQNFWSQQQQQTQQPFNNQMSSNINESSMGIENNQMGLSQISTNYSNSNNTYNPQQSYNYNNSVSNTVLPNNYFQNSTSSSNTYPQMQQTNLLAQNQGASSLFQSSSSNTNNLKINKPNNNIPQNNGYLSGGQQNMQQQQQQQQMQGAPQNNLLLFPANDGKKQQPKKNEPFTRASKLIGSNNNQARIK